MCVELLYLFLSFSLSHLSAGWPGRLEAVKDRTGGGGGGGGGGPWPSSQLRCESSEEKEDKSGRICYNWPHRFLLMQS